jgi:2'-5' RNA ligase
MIRLFTAVAIPRDLAEDLVPRQYAIEGAQWRPVEAFHITLRFIGEMTEPAAADLDEALAGIEVPAFDLRLEGAGHFGEGDDIHAVWAGVAKSPELTRLQKANEAAARHAGLKPESRAYTPHVTLAYLKKPPVAEVASWIQGHNLLRSPPFRVDRFGLYSSWRTSHGSAYRLEAEYPLG